MTISLLESGYTPIKSYPFVLCFEKNHAFCSYRTPGYASDLLLTGRNTLAVMRLEMILVVRCAMMDLDEPHFGFGIHTIRDRAAGTPGIIQPKPRRIHMERYTGWPTAIPCTPGVLWELSNVQVQEKRLDAA